MAKHTSVMIIDDSEMDTFLNKMILQTLNFSEEILTFTNPIHALEYFQKLSREENQPRNIPEIVFLDINMPIMSGFVFLEEFGKLPQKITSGVKFFMISSSEDPEDIEKTRKHPNIIKYLNKPLDKKELL
ncbi:MAG: response regulator [Cytophagaceae bacterium]|nr:response regulator [Cytophagaceae bacterium]